MVEINLKKANILIVDDQQANIDVLTEFLGIAGYQNIKATTDPRLALSLCKSFYPDLILLDLIMPHLSGYEVMDQLKAMLLQNPYLPVLVLTADISVQTKQHALAGGAKDFLAKPFDLIEVGLRINNLLESRFLYRQLENQNQILEERIKERIAELEKLNIDLVVAKEKAEASDRLKTAFLQNISHEIRTPLNGILGFGIRLAKKSLTEEKKEEYLDVLKSSTERLANTVNNYLDIAQIVSGNMQVHNAIMELDQLMREIYSKFRQPCQLKNLSLILKMTNQNDHFLLKSDYKLLLKVLSHLIDNAIKFTNVGTITFGFELKREELEFFVQDTGIGITDKAISLIFDHFMQEDVSSTRHYEGSGLGLSISKKIVEIIGGRIWLQSVKNKGSVFYFTIPYLDVAPELSVN